MGFNFVDGAPEYINPTNAAAIIGWLAGPKPVGKFRNRDAEEMAAIAGTAAVEILQVDKDSLPEALRIPEKPIFLEIDGTESDTELSGLDERVTHFVLVPAEEVAEELAQVVKRIQHIKPVLLDTSIDKERLQTTLESWNPAGLVLRGGEEEKVGVKSFEDLDELMEKLVYGD